MNRLIIVLLVGLVSLAGCQNSSRSDSLSLATPEWQDSMSTAETTTKQELPPPTALATIGGEAADPTLDAENPDALSMASSGGANADVLFVKAQLTADESWTFMVTVDHPDSGWEDYADGWDVVLPDGTVVKSDQGIPFTRLLLHPHEAERPFTRSQAGIIIPPGIELVTVRAHDLVDGFGGIEVVVDLAAASGPDFEVIR